MMIKCYLTTLWKYTLSPRWMAHHGNKH